MFLPILNRQLAGRFRRDSFLKSFRKIAVRLFLGVSSMNHSDISEETYSIVQSCALSMFDRFELRMI